ncbi:MAG: 1,2-phenylacetyl-CoA epoxidase subunit PaaC [Flavobacteriales bacterium]
MTNSHYYTYLLRLADDSLILGQRLSEWCGHGPILEEDIALSNIALDYVGQATNLFKQLSDSDTLGRDEDAIALTRQESEYCNLLLLELPNGDYACTIARQYYYSSFYLLFLEQLKLSNDAFLAGFAEKSIKEVKYHVQHATDWMLRLGDGTVESHQRMQQAVNALWPYLGELFSDDELDATSAKEGWGVNRTALKQPWMDRLQALLDECGLELPTESWHHKGGRSGRHTEHMGYLLAEMQYLQRAFPGAKW